MCQSLLGDVKRLHDAVVRLAEEGPQTESAREEVCQASRFMWYSVRSAHRMCHDLMTPPVAQFIDELFTEAIAELSKHPRDVYLDNTEARYKGPDGILPILQEVLHPAPV